MKNLNRLVMLMALATGMALAQGMPQQSPGGTPPTMPQSQQQTPPTPDQTQPGAQPSTAPDQTQPTSDQGAKDNSKMPQSDASASMTSSTDVQNSIESALKQDAALANSNVQVKVTDKKVELSGDVNSKDEKKAAEKIAKDNAAGRKVKNHLKVASATNPADQSKNPPSNPYPKQ